MAVCLRVEVVQVLVMGPIESLFTRRPLRAIRLLSDMRTDVCIDIEVFAQIQWAMGMVANSALFIIGNH